MRLRFPTGEVYIKAQANFYSRLSYKYARMLYACPGERCVFCGCRRVSYLADIGGYTSVYKGSESIQAEGPIEGA